MQSYKRIGTSHPRENQDVAEEGGIRKKVCKKGVRVEELIERGGDDKSFTHRKRSK